MIDTGDPIAIARAYNKAQQRDASQATRAHILLAHMNALDLPPDHADGWRAALDNLIAGMAAAAPLDRFRHQRAKQMRIQWLKLAELWKEDRRKLASWQS